MNVGYNEAVKTGSRAKHLVKRFLRGRRSQWARQIELTGGSEAARTYMLVSGYSPEIATTQQHIITRIMFNSRRVSRCRRPRRK